MSIDPAMFGRVRSTATDGYVAPRLEALASTARLYSDVPRWKRSLKRGMDVLIASVALLCFGLVLPILAMIIKLDSRGPVFYRQTRVGIDRRGRERRARGVVASDADRRCQELSRDRRKVVASGKPFEIIKLRTMHVDAESDGIRWAERGDPRITRIGKWLRLSRLDEFPQFWNVIRGEMSVVGPRPERPPFIELLSDEVPGYLDRLRFKPGITGLAQVELGYDTDVESVQRKVAMDVRYITEFSLLRDLHLLLRTFAVVFTGRGAY